MHKFEFSETCYIPNLNFRAKKSHFDANSRLFMYMIFKYCVIIQIGLSVIQQNEQVVATTLKCVSQSQFVVENAIYCSGPLVS